jgi:aspartate racemase
MRVIGLMGGMSWESSLEYYRILNEIVRQRLGGLHSAECVLYSVNFGRIEELQHKDRWDELLDILSDCAGKLERAGAELLLICSNTMHIIADEIEMRIGIPLLHIVDVTAERIKDHRLRKVGLLGTKFTMERDFYTERLRSKHGLEVLIPDQKDRQIIHEIIYSELCMGKIEETSRESFRRVIAKLTRAGAEGIILGCTEIPLLVSEADSSVPLFDTTRIHAEAAVDYAL